jgi:predicted PurR-regulated permease PerM
MVVAGIPGAGLWTVACLLLSVIQVGPGIVLVGTVIYMFSEATTLAAVLYTAWAIPVSLLDNVLKPILMGRGSEVPVIVIFLGVIGGTFAHGLIGVFVGPVVLAVGYVLFAAWVKGSTG